MTTIHTYPLNDVVEHTTDSDDCICGPTVEPIKCDDGSVAWQIIHHSLDGRELREKP